MDIAGLRIDAHRQGGAVLHCFTLLASRSQQGKEQGGVAFSLVIRDGLVVDGSGREPFVGDVALEGSLIAKVGRFHGVGTTEIDARGALVTPGFVDIQTHHQSQFTKADSSDSGGWHGVTTLLAADSFLPTSCFESAGLRRESSVSRADAVGAQAFPVDVGIQVTQERLRLRAMGQRALAGEPATAADCERMRVLAVNALRAGALGISVSRNQSSCTVEQEGRLALQEPELQAIADALKGADSGWMQIDADVGALLGDGFDMLERIAARARRPVAIGAMEDNDRSDAGCEILRRIAAANQQGLRMHAQVGSRPLTSLLGLETGDHPFSDCPSYQRMAHLHLGERVRLLHDPAVRIAILSEYAANASVASCPTRWERLFRLGAMPEYEPAPGESLLALARRVHRSPEEFTYDHLLTEGGRALLVFPRANCAHGNLDGVRRMMTSRNSLLGHSGAMLYQGQLPGVGDPTFLLTYWTRGRKRGGLLPMLWAVRKLTRDNAMAAGLADRGLIGPGFKADLNVIDLSQLRLHRPEVVHEVDGGGQRIIQRAAGYRATIVSGIVVQSDGVGTGALPGRLIRAVRAGRAPPARRARTIDIQLQL